MKKRKIIETILFILIWHVIMLAGADFPPPPGFRKVSAGILGIAFVQWFYLDWLLRHLHERKSFLVTEIFYALAGLFIILTLILMYGGFQKDGGILVAVVTAVAALYGIFFWFLNRVISYLQDQRIIR